MTKIQPQKSRSYLLVDLENVGIFDPLKADKCCRILVFTGHAQKSISIDLVRKTQLLGSRLEWKSLNKAGNNALDFYISYNLGQIFHSDKQAECTVLSKDKGFDPLIALLKSDGYKCSRIETQAKSIV